MPGRRAEEPGARSAAAAPRARQEWEARLATLSSRKRAEFERRLRHERPAALAKALKAHKKSLLETPQNIATRKSSEAGDRCDRRPRCRWNSSRAPPTSPAPTTTRRNPRRLFGQDAEGPFHPLRHPRARHGGGPERHLPAWRLCAERRHLPGVHRLCPPGDAARGADGNRRGLCHDPRFDRARRRRPDPSAGRASRGAARHSQHARVPPLRCDRGCRSAGNWR